MLNWHFDENFVTGVFERIFLLSKRGIIHFYFKPIRYSLQNTKEDHLYECEILNLDVDWRLQMVVLEKTEFDCQEKSEDWNSFSKKLIPIAVFGSYGSKSHRTILSHNQKSVDENLDEWNPHGVLGEIDSIDHNEPHDFAIFISLPYQSSNTRNRKLGLTIE